MSGFAKFIYNIINSRFKKFIVIVLTAVAFFASGYDVSNKIGIG